MNRTRSRAAFGAAAVIATLVASGAGISPALGAPASASQAVHDASHGSKDRGSEDHGSKSKSKDKDKDKDGKGSKGGKSNGDKLAKAVAKLDEAFERLLSRAEKKLDDESYAQVASNIATDRALLASLTSLDEVRALQPENYDQVIAWLRKAERLASKVDATDPTATGVVSALVEQLATITASSGKADLLAAKRLLSELRDLADAAEGEAIDDSGNDSTDDSGNDSTDDSGNDSADDSGNDADADDDEDEDEDETGTEVEGGEGGESGA